MLVSIGAQYGAERTGRLLAKLWVVWVVSNEACSPSSVPPPALVAGAVPMSLELPFTLDFVPVLGVRTPTEVS